MYKAEVWHHLGFCGNVRPGIVARAPPRLHHFVSRLKSLPETTAMNLVWFFFNINITFLRIETVSPNKIYSRVSIFSYTPNTNQPFKCNLNAYATWTNQLVPSSFIVCVKDLLARTWHWHTISYILSSDWWLYFLASKQALSIIPNMSTFRLWYLCFLCQIFTDIYKL